MTIVPTLLVEVPLEEIGKTLQGRFISDQSMRLTIEQEWVKDLKQYDGKYDETVKIPTGASRLFIKRTRTKVRTLDARMGELALPVGSDAWEIEPTPDPDIGAEREAYLRDQLTQLALQAGKDPSAIAGEHLKELEIEFAKAAAKKMSRKMSDSLVECRFTDVARAVLHSGHLFGTGIMKGPLVWTRSVKGWSRVGGGKFAISERAVKKPYVEMTRIWDYFPDMTSRSFYETDHDTQRHVFGLPRMQELAQRPDFRGKVILDYLHDHPEGDAEWTNYDQNIHLTGRDAPSGNEVKPGRRWAVLETYSLFDANDFSRMGVELPEELRGLVLEGEIWIFQATGDVIKARLNPQFRDARPWSFYVPEPEEGRLFGLSAPYNGRDTSQLLNATVRAAVDNMALGALPQFVVDASMIDADHETDIESIRPGRVWYQMSQPGSTGRLLSSIDVPLQTPIFLQMAANAEKWDDEAMGIPSFQSGERSPGVGRTVGGLSMLMAAANVLTKEQLRSWDECLERFLGRLHDWFMQNDEDESIKGDFRIKVRGAYSVMAKEFKSEKLQGFLTTVAASPLLASVVDLRKLLSEYAQVLELPLGIVKTEQRIQSEQAAMLAAQQPVGEGGDNGQPPVGGGEGASSAPGGPTGGTGIPQGQGVVAPTSGQPPAGGPGPGAGGETAPAPR